MRDKFWKIWILLGFGAIALYFTVLPKIPWGTEVDYFLISAATAGCLFAGARLHRPQRPWIWYLLGAGMACWAIGDGIFESLTAFSTTIPYPSLSDPFFLLAYPLFGAALLFANRSQRTGSRKGTVIDAGIITIGALILFYIVLMRPYLEDPSSPLMAKLVSVAYPVGDLFLLGVLATRAAGRGTTSTRLLLSWLPLLIVADVIFAVMTIHGTYVSGSWVDAGWLIGYVLLGASALHPSMASAPAKPEEQLTTRSIGRVRVSLLAIASLVGPVLICVEAIQRDVRDIYVVAAGCMILAVLVLARIMGLIREADVRRQELRDAMVQLSYQALHDPLTGLGNRTLFADRIAHASARSGRQELGLTVLLIDLDDFKAVNDGLGHAIGDDLLVAVAERLLIATRESDTVARLGGDEFAILVEDHPGGEGPIRAADRILNGLAVPYDLGGRTVFMSASIGIARHHTPASGNDTLRHADVAMYMAKAAGKARHVSYEPEMGAAAVSLIELKTEMRRALDANFGEFVVHYQPIVALASKDILGVEALVRWIHPSRGLLPPNDFLPVAEETGMIVRIGKLVLQDACTRVAGWRRSIAGMEDLTVSVNLSSRQVQDKDLLTDVRRALTDAGLAPEALILELTEDLLLRDVETVNTVLHSLTSLGVRISVDDFGAGNSSMSYLKRFPITELKIDKSCVEDLAGASADSSLVQGMIHLGRAVHLRMVAEGIEEPDQVTALRDMGCEIGQGFLFARPRPADELENLLVTGLPTGETMVHV
jgi:diguanylate cyclase (GGDEF)-like protein